MKRFTDIDLENARQSKLGDALDIMKNVKLGCKQSMMKLLEARLSFIHMAPLARNVLAKITSQNQMKRCQIHRSLKNLNLMHQRQKK